MKSPILFTLGVSALCLVSAAAIAQETPAAPQPFCENNEGFSDWDFWVGDWNVYTNDEARRFQGTNSITRHYNNCLLKEDWKGAGGGGGFSVNYYNPIKNEWRQVWVANGYSIDYAGGLDDNGSMVLEGTIYNYRQKTTNRFRGIWTPQKNGDVIQHFDVHNADDDTWNAWFEGRYVRKETDPNPPGRD